MRRVLIAEFLARADARSAIETLSHLIERAHRSDAFVVALDSLGAALADKELVDYDTRCALYAEAKEMNRLEVAQLLFSTPAAADAAKREAALQTRPIEPRGRPLTLGERKSLARGRDRQELTKLLCDPHPAVVEILLGNPHITEADVLALASRRPSLPRALEMIYASERWIARHPVKRALVLNPNTPIAIASALVITLHDADVREVARDVNLSGAVRAQASAVLARRDD